MRRLAFVTSTILLIVAGCSRQDYQPEVQKLNSPTSSLMQAISQLDEEVVWVSGHQASFARSTNGGQSWELFRHPTGDTLQFRDIHAFDSEKAILMSAGPGPMSRIFSFEAPNTWSENFVMQDSLGFLDCIDFWDDQRGIAYGDAIDDFPYILLTSDGGLTWRRADSASMPKAGKGEGGFAASGTCVVTSEDGKAWIATGAGGNCRFLITQDYGKSWSTVDSPLITGAAAGNTSVSFSDEIGVVTGGDLTMTSEYTENTAFSQDGGLTWQLSNHPQTTGAFYGSAITDTETKTLAFVCGPNGIDYTEDLGQTWNTLDSLNYWAISMKGEVGYAVGTDGKILKITLQP